MNEKEKEAYFEDVAHIRYTASKTCLTLGVISAF